MSKVSELSVLKSGAIVQATSLVSLVLANLSLPLVFGRADYGLYTLIMAKALIPLGLIDIPADVAFLSAARGVHGDSPARWQYMPAKMLLSSALALTLAVMSRTSWLGTIAVLAIAVALSMLSSVLHEAYLLGDGVCAIEVAVIMLLTQLAVPILLGALLDPSVTALLAGILAIVLVQHPRRRVARGWRLPRALGLRLLFGAFRRQACASYMSSVIQWAAVLRVGLSSPIDVGPMKLSFAMMNGAQAMVPMSGSIVLSSLALEEPDNRESAVRRLWGVALGLSAALALVLVLLRSVVDRIYGRDYPEVVELLPLAAAGVVGMTVYWLFWPVTGGSEGSSNRRWPHGPLTAVALVTAGSIGIGGASIASGLALYVGGITVGAWVASVQAGVGRWSVLVVLPACVLSAYHVFG